VQTGLQAYPIGQKHIDKKFFGFLQCTSNLCIFFELYDCIFFELYDVAVVMVLQSQEGGE